MLRMLGAVFKYIDQHPRLILLGKDPVLSLFLAALILIVWKGPWIVITDIQHQQLSILGSIALGVLGTMTLNQLAQSMIFFGKLGVKLGSFLDVNAEDNDIKPTAQPTRDLRDQ